MIEANHSLEDEFRTPDRVRAHIVEIIVTKGLVLVDDLHHQGNPSEVLEDLLLDLHASRRDHRSFESWCHQNVPLPLAAIRADLKPTLWAWKQLVDSVPIALVASRRTPLRSARRHTLLDNPVLDGLHGLI